MSKELSNKLRGYANEARAMAAQFYPGLHSLECSEREHIFRAAADELDQRDAAQTPPRTTAQRIASIIASSDNGEIAAVRILYDVMRPMLEAAYGAGSSQRAANIGAFGESYECPRPYADRIISEALGKKD